MTTVRLMLATTLLTAGTGAAAQANFEGSGQEARIDCDGGTARITGATNTLVVDGPCTLLVVEGAANTVTVDLAEKSAIRVTGAGNRITWRAPARTRPRISSNGAGNTFRRAP